MATYCLEIAAFTLSGALTAQQAGAHRIELCENPHEGGTTPSYGILAEAIRCINIPVFPIIRPRGGNFVYSNEEFRAMIRDIDMCRDLGFPGVVSGILLADGQVDKIRTAELLAASGPMSFTFHRAFDRCRNPFAALEDIIELGCDRILSSGQCPSVMNGLDVLAQLQEQAAQRITIMPGSGLRSVNVQEIARRTGAKEFHTAARTAVYHDEVYSPSSMQERLGYVDVDAEEVQLIGKELNLFFNP
jgi:copper homeostasis protein